MNDTKSIKKPWINVGWSLVFLGYIGILVVISVLAYRNQLRGIFTANDKLGHFVLFGSAGLLSHLALNQRCWKIGRCSIPIGPVVLALLVVVEESFQAMSPNRTAGLSDIIANWLGILVFVSVGMFIIRRARARAISS